MIKITKIILEFIVIILSTVGFITLFVEFVNEYEDIRLRFIDWKNKECKIKCLCNHSYSIKYLWFADKEVCLECPKCNKVKRIKLDDNLFETFADVWRKEWEDNE